MRMQVVSIVCVALLASACNTLSEASDKPAVIIRPSDESRAELLRVLSSALKGIRITLAADVLTNDSLLTLERNPPRDLRARQLTGRQLERPQQFRLVMNGSDCILVDLSNGVRWRLRDTLCAPE